MHNPRIVMLDKPKPLQSNPKGYMVVSRCVSALASLVLAFLTAILANSVRWSSMMGWRDFLLLWWPVNLLDLPPIKQTKLVAVACAGLVALFRVFNKQWKEAWVVANLVLFGPTILGGCLLIVGLTVSDRNYPLYVMRYILNTTKVLVTPVLLPMWIVWFGVVLWDHLFAGRRQRIEQREPPYRMAALSIGVTPVFPLALLPVALLILHCDETRIQKLNNVGQIIAITGLRLPPETILLGSTYSPPFVPFFPAQLTAKAQFPRRYAAMFLNQPLLTARERCITRATGVDDRLQTWRSTFEKEGWTVSPQARVMIIKVPAKQQDTGEPCGTVVVLVELAEHKEVVAYIFYEGLREVWNSDKHDVN